MPFEQYHEPANELPEEVRTFARMIISMIEEAEAINWYEPRMAVEKPAMCPGRFGSLATLGPAEAAVLALLQRRSTRDQTEQRRLVRAAVTLK